MVTVRSALSDDVASISDLLMANAAERGGTLYGDWSSAVVDEWIKKGALILLATDDSKTIGALFAVEKGQSTARPVQAMLAAWPGAADAYVYGPVCIDETARGRGVLEALFSHLTSLRPGRECILFINIQNKRSLNAHERLGLKRVASFVLDRDEYFVLSSHTG